MNFAFVAIGNMMSFGRLLTYSIRAFHPDSNIIQISDSDAPDIKGVNDRINFNFKKNQIMKNRLETQIICLKKYGSVIFLDSDMILVKGIGELEKYINSSDLVFVDRYEDHILKTEFKGIKFPEFENKYLNELMPFIGSFLGCRNIHALNETLSIYNMLDSKYSFWYGDQIALKKLYDLNIFNIKIIKSLKYNYSPNNLNDFPKNVSILHFKGFRKDFATNFVTKIFGENAFEEIF